MTNLHKWDHWYSGLCVSEPQAYGDTTTYHLAADWLGDMQVEDWGCGKGFFRTLIPSHFYTGVDGSSTPFADKIVDLCSYRSHVEGILLRHVLEHNDNWTEILANALVSATERIVLILFTPMTDVTTVICRPDDIDVPDISFSHFELMSHVEPAGWTATWADHQTATQYGVERVYLLERT